ncbi:MAG TPA: helix-turn-helix domain-containing protein [Gemmatimonadaceae bacterium]|nr:helix-turn-helix domain-containing protein [Gemmatimonadaceae bacterium]
MTKASSKRRASPRAAIEDRDGDTEQRILQAARSVFVRRGTSGARMQEIAAEAGVNQALLHYYFRSKQRLAEAIFREAAGRLVPAVLRLLGSDAPLEQKVEGFVHLYIDTVREQPFLPGYILAELHQHPERVRGLREAIGLQPATVAKTLLARLRTQLDEGAKSGTLRRIAPEQFVVSLLALTVFPFAARPVLDLALGMDDDAFARFLDQRRTELPPFILSALRP